MKKSGNKIKNILKIGLLSLLGFPFLLGGISYGVDDLLYQLMRPSINNQAIINMGENVNTVGQNVFEGSIDFDLLEIDTDLHFTTGTIVKDKDGNPKCGWGKNPKPCIYECTQVTDDNRELCKKEWRYKYIDESYRDISGGISRSPSIIVKVTRILLSLVITLSVTMILYNGMIYIIQTGQGKEGKNLVKNIIYIAVGIILSIFSVIIITIIQSVPKTIEEEVGRYDDNELDNDALQDEELILGWEARFDESGHDSTFITE